MKSHQSITQHLIIAVAAASCTFAQAPQSVTNSASIAYGQLPLVFEPNVGQTDPQVRFLTRNQGMTVFFTDSEAVMVLHRREQGQRGRQTQTVRMRLLGSTTPSGTAGLDRLPGVSNYFIGSDPEAWRTNIPQYGRVRHTGVYPGIDLVYYGNNSKLEYDFVVAPNANPDQVQLSWDGVDAININDAGDLVLKTPLGDVIQKKPRVYQDTPSGRREIAANYMLFPKSRVGFALARYDRTSPLVIDPVVVYSTYWGSTSFDEGLGIAVDSFGQAYMTGWTNSKYFPGTPTSPNDPMKSQPGSDDAFVTKFTADGSNTIYSTTTLGAYRTKLIANQDAFVTKVSPSGVLLYSTLLAETGTHVGNGIAVDGTGSAYVTGASTGNIAGMTANSTTGDDGFVVKLTPAGDSVLYATYLAGSKGDYAHAIAVDTLGAAYVAGVTYSSDLLSSPNRPYSVSADQDAFILKLAGNAPPSPAQIVSPIPGTVTGSSNVIFTWTSVPAAAGYKLEVGTYQGGHDIYQGQITSATSALVANVPLYGILLNKYYWVRLTTYFAGGSTPVDYRYIGGLTPANSVATMQTPAPGSVLSLLLVTFTWNAGSGASSYKLDVGTQAPTSDPAWSGNIFSQNMGQSLKASVYPLPIPATIYVRLTTIINGSVYWNDYTYTTSTFRK